MKSRLKTKTKKTTKNPIKGVQKRPPEVFFYISALDDEFRRQLAPDYSLEQVRDDYLEWVEEVEELIDRFGPEMTVADIVKKMG